MTVAAPLPDNVLARRALLPLKPQVERIHGRYISLVPYSPANHESALYQLCNGS